MSLEPDHRFPKWAERERRSDMGWIAENAHILWPAAQTAYTALGRGAITVDTTSQPIAGLGNPFAYLAQAELDPLQDVDMQRMLRDYDPARNGRGTVQTVPAHQHLPPPAFDQNLT